MEADFAYSINMWGAGLDLFFVPATFAKPMSTLTSITPQQLRRAADIQERILSLQAELSSLLESGAELRATAASYGMRRGKRRLSAQGLANIRAGARRRWAKARTAGGALRAGKRRRMSPSQRARLSAIAKARWVKARAQGRAHL